MTRLCVLVCLVIAVSGYDPDCDDCHRVRRSRNYYGPSPKFYKPPPNIYPVKGPFSYTPPPGYGTHDSGPPSHRANQVSKRHHPGLGEEDLHNIVKYLSKHDLDKIFQMARKKGKYNDDSDDHSFERDTPVHYTDSRPTFPDSAEDFQSGKIFDGPYENYRSRPKGFEHDLPPNIYNSNEYLDQGPPRGNKFYSKPPIDIEESTSRFKGLEHKPASNIYNEYLEQGPPKSNKFYSKSPLDTDESIPRPKGFEQDLRPNVYNNIEYSDQGPHKGDFYSPAPLDGNESMLYHKVSLLDEYIDKVIADDLPHAKKNGVTKTHDVWKPEPINDFEIAFTNKAPNVIKSESSSYKLENFADLPLMNFDDSKLDTVNSYNVPHYTVTSHGHSQPPTNPFMQKTQSSAGKDQSDAHLKAIRIWTHKSKGSAYTLHDDGTLSPERPSRPKF